MRDSGTWKYVNRSSGTMLLVGAVSVRLEGKQSWIPGKPDASKIESSVERGLISGSVTWRGGLVHGLVTHM